MPEKVTLSHRGARYEIGMGKRYYAIWVVGAPRTDPVDRWPETADGWSQAWARFTAIETPGTIAPVPRKRAFSGGPRGTGRVRARAGGVLLAAGVLLGVAGLFPAYFTGQSLASTSGQLVPHVMDLVAWAVAAAAALLGGSRARIGGLLGAGLSAVTLGLFASDLATATSGHEGVADGLVITLVSWLACALGSALALTAAHDGKAADAALAPDSAPGAAGALGAAVTERLAGAPRRRFDAGTISLLVLCAIGTGTFFVPAWDSYTLTASATGTTQTVTAGNAFDNPGWVIAGNMATVVALVVVAIAAALWRPARYGSALLAGAVVAMAGQAISALLQASQPASPGMFGISSAQAQAARLTISSGVTSIFWVYVVFVIAMIISCAWLATAPNGGPVNLGPAYPGTPYPAGGYQSVSYPAPSYPVPSQDSGAGTGTSSGPRDATAADDGEHAADDAERDAAGEEQQAAGEEHRAAGEGQHADSEVSMP